MYIIKAFTVKPWNYQKLSKVWLLMQGPTVVDTNTAVNIPVYLLQFWCLCIIQAKTKLRQAACYWQHISFAMLKKMHLNNLQQHGLKGASIILFSVYVNI